ncbi:MAG: TVP38/TMEM64 family protein [Ruminiclostridium sp.]|nr:TVP38/TMEM64 family protein [Ruminiclostridium sp.]
METTPHANESKRKALAILALLVFLAVIGFLGWRIGIPMVQLASDPEVFRQKIQDSSLNGQLIFIGMVVLQILAAIIPGEPLEIAGGYAFGAIEGTILCLLGGMIGSFLVIMLVRRFGIRLVHVFYPPEKLESVRFLKSSPKRTVLFLLIFMIPGTPKDLLCYFVGLTDMKLPVLMVICTLGRLPAIVSSTIGGNALGTEQYIFAAIVFGVTFLISMSGLILYNAICKKHNESA